MKPEDRLKDKIVNCNNCSTIFDTRNYVRYEDALKAVKDASKALEMNLSKDQLAPFIENNITVNINEPTYREAGTDHERFWKDLEFGNLYMVIKGMAEIAFTRRGEWTIKGYSIEDITVTDLDTIVYQVTDYQCKQLCNLFYAEI